MDLAELTAILTKAKDIPHTNFTHYPFTDRPIGFRGGENGKLLAGLKNHQRHNTINEYLRNEPARSVFGYIGEERSSDPRGTTLYAPTLVDAGIYCMNRTDRACGGGRYDEQGKQLPHRFGFPYLIAIDLAPYLSRLGKTGNPGEMEIYGTIARADFVILFDRYEDHLIDLIPQTPLYNELIQRKEQASGE